MEHTKYVVRSELNKNALDYVLLNFETTNMTDFVTLFIRWLAGDCDSVFGLTDKPLLFERVTKFLFDLRVFEICVNLFDLLFNFAWWNYYYNLVIKL